MATSDPNGGNVTAAITSISGGPPGVGLPVPASRTVAAGSNAVFTTAGVRNGLTYTVNGNVTDPSGASSGNRADTFVCAPPPPTISCSFTVNNSMVSAGVETFTISAVVTRNQDAFSPVISGLTGNASISSTPAQSRSGHLAHSLSVPDLVRLPSEHR